ncbi:hypothetical protein D6C77_01456 [Aureobasidium pullulans]|nr:hypothetical protein D6C77_01456 [Aureobasidium pullulans]
MASHQIIRDTLRCTECAVKGVPCNKIDISINLERPCSTCHANGCRNGDNADMWLAFRSTVINDIVPAHLVNNLKALLDANFANDPILLFASLALVAYSPVWVQYNLGPGLLDQATDLKRTFRYDNNSCFTGFVMHLILAPTLMACLPSGPTDTLAADLTGTLRLIAVMKNTILPYHQIFDGNLDSRAFIRNSLSTGHQATASVLEQRQPVSAMIGVINAIPATTWGNHTDDCKKFLRIAITDVYELDDRRIRALSQTNPATNVEREVLQWLAVSQFPPGFLDTVGTHHLIVRSRKSTSQRC